VETKQNFREVCKAIAQMEKIMQKQITYIEKLKDTRKKGGLVV